MGVLEKNNKVNVLKFKRFDHPVDNVEMFNKWQNISIVFKLPDNDNFWLSLIRSPWQKRYPQRD